MKKATLGRGLDALIPKENREQGLTLVSIHEIRPNTRQPRKDFDDDAIAELTASIKEKGIIQPIVVRQAGSGYEIIAGERRWRAAQRAGIVRVPVVVKDAIRQGGARARAHREPSEGGPEPDRRGFRIPASNRGVRAHA